MRQRIVMDIYLLIKIKLNQVAAYRRLYRGIGVSGYRGQSQ